MKISFTGLENQIVLAEKGITVLQIKNEALYSRVCGSLITLQGENALEPYSLWENDREVSSSRAFIVVPNPFELPWKHKCLMGALYPTLEKELLIDRDLQQEMSELGSLLESSIHKLGFQMNANYRFGLEWNFSSYLKAFSFEVEVFEDASLLEKLIGFIDFCADMAADKVIVFINLRTFLTETELIEFQNRLFFHGISVLLLENTSSLCSESYVRKYLIDQDFVEHIIEGKSDCLSSVQGRICSNGFGAVTI